VDGTSRRADASLTPIESVRCLACGALYAKLVDGGTTATNPGCPDCGYLGWRSLTDDSLPLLSRFAAGPQRTRLA
jgi:predicted  nucleic acid-binding Zn-ribbon protein